MKKSFLYIIVASFTAITCNNLDVDDLSQRNTFLKFYEGPYSITATAMEIIPDGYIVVGNMIVEDEVNDTIFFETVVIKTDKNGNRTGEYSRIPGGTGKSIKPLINNGAVTGYVVVGDSIHIDPLAEQAANVSISSLRALYLNNNLELVGKPFRLSDTIKSNLIKEDFTGESVEITSDGRVLILGTSKRGVVNQQTAPAEPFVLALKSDFTTDWLKRYDLIGRTSQNSKSIHYNNGKIIWASAIADVAGDFVNSWVGIPIVDENSIFPNYSVIGQNTDQLFIPNDIQPASSPAFGYGVVGTYSEETKGSKGNIFFLRVDINGTIITGSDKYFDAVDLPVNGPLVNKNDSFIIDTGDAITSTLDGGFVLAGTLSTNADKGNGGLDLFLIKVNAVGDPVWFKTIGGAGDETPATIRETAEGDLIVCGTNKLGDYSTVFLMKTDKNGELKN
jgi:hypothetical protein